MKTQLHSDPIETAELVLFSTPPNLLDTVRGGRAETLATRPLNIFYAKADSIGKAIKKLKGKCRPLIIERRNEGTAFGENGQHRQFRYTSEDGDITVTVQERMEPKIDITKLEALLKERGLWETATTTSIDLDKVDGLLRAGIINAADLYAISGKPEATYALIAKIEGRK